MYICTYYPTESTSLKCAVALGLMMSDEDLGLTPDFFSPKIKKIQMGRFS